VTGSSNDCASQFSTTNGGNTALKPEESDNATLGIVFEPTNNISIAIDAFKIDLKETIVNGIAGDVILADLNQFGFLVTRAAPDAAFPNLPGRITNISQTNINLGRTKLSGFDVDAKVGIPAADWGKFTVNLIGTYFSKFDAENLDGSFTSAIDTPNTSTGGLIPRWKHYLSVDWTRGPWSVTVAQNYQSDYIDQCGNLDDCSPGNTPLRTVKAYEVYDVQVAYSGIRNLRLTLGAKNVLNTDPPFTLTGGNVSFQAGYDPQYADPRGRFVYGRVTYSFK
jgi:iron complex outermembrane receptor protein